MLLRSVPVKSAFGMLMKLTSAKKAETDWNVSFESFIKKSKRCDERWNDKVENIVDIILSDKGQNIGT